MSFDPEVHRRHSIRLRQYDYSRTGAYFVTICTHDRQCLFGDVVDGEMRVNEAGKMVRDIWDSLPGHFQTVQMDQCVVMPNHFHGIIFIFDQCRGESCIRPGRADCIPGPAISAQGACRGESCIRPGRDIKPKNQGDHKDRPYGTTENSLGRVIQAFKSLTTNAYITGVDTRGWPPFDGRIWQRNYHERILRDDGELHAIREYLANNSRQWALDVENPAAIRPCTSA